MDLKRLLYLPVELWGRFGGFLLSLLERLIAAPPDWWGWFGLCLIAVVLRTLVSIGGADRRFMLKAMAWFAVFATFGLGCEEARRALTMRTDSVSGALSGALYWGTLLSAVGAGVAALAMIRIVWIITFGVIRELRRGR